MAEIRSVGPIVLVKVAKLIFISGFQAPFLVKISSEVLKSKKMRENGVNDLQKHASWRKNNGYLPGGTFPTQALILCPPTERVHDPQSPLAKLCVRTKEYFVQQKNWIHNSLSARVLGLDS